MDFPDKSEKQCRASIIDDRSRRVVGQEMFKPGKATNERSECCEKLLHALRMDVSGNRGPHRRVDSGQFKRILEFPPRDYGG